MRKKRAKKIFYPVVLAAVLLTGCGSSEIKVDEMILEKADTLALEGTTIKLFGCDDWVKDTERELAMEFEAQTGIQIEFELLAAEDYQEKLMTRLSGSDTPDIFMAQSGSALETTYEVQNRAVDLSDEIWVDNYSIFSKEQSSVDGKVYGMTYYDTTTDYYLIYNKKLFAAAGIDGIPESYDEFADDCEKLKNSGVVPIYEPVADGWHQTMLWADSGQIFELIEPGVVEKLNTNKEKFADNKNMLKAMNQINDLARFGYFGNNFSVDTFDAAESYLASGEYAMCLLKPGAISSIVANDLNVGYKESDFGIMLFPLCDNRFLNVHPTGPTRFISVGSDNVEAAKLYFEFLASKSCVQYMIDNCSTVENLPFELGQNPGYEKVTEEFISKYDETNAGTVLQDSVLYFNEQWGEISADMAEMFNGRLTPEQVLINVDKRRSELAKRSGDINW